MEIDLPEGKLTDLAASKYSLDSGTPRKSLSHSSQETPLVKKTAAPQMCHDALKNMIPSHQIVSEFDEDRINKVVVKVSDRLDSGKIKLMKGASKKWQRVVDDKTGFSSWKRIETEPQPAQKTVVTRQTKDFVLMYSEEEFDKYLKDPSWTREETDLLFQLCIDYDLRFIVVYDRFISACKETPNIRPKPIELLKERYYRIQQFLLQSRATNPDQVQNHPVVKSRYNMKKDMDRRVDLEKFFQRPAEPYLKAAEVALSMRKDHGSRELKKRDLKQLKFFDAIRKNRLISSSLHRSSPSRKSEEEDLKYLLSGLPESVTQTTQNAIKSKTRGSSLRRHQPHQTLLGSHKAIKNVDQELLKMGFPKMSPLEVPSALSCELFDCIREDLMILYRLEKHVQKKEQDLHHIKVQLESLALRKSKYTPLHNLKRRMSGSSKDYR